MYRYLSLMTKKEESIRAGVGLHRSVVRHLPNHDIPGIHAKVSRILIIVTRGGRRFSMSGKILPESIAIRLSVTKTLFTWPTISARTSSFHIVFVDWRDQSPAASCRAHVAKCSVHTALKMKNKDQLTRIDTKRRVWKAKLCRVWDNERMQRNIYHHKMVPATYLERHLHDFLHLEWADIPSHFFGLPLMSVCSVVRRLPELFLCV